jgi:translation initiation factor 1 (eIF-1/SUI1)
MKLLQSFKKECSCNGNVAKGEGGSDMIQLRGDQKDEAKKFLEAQLSGIEAVVMRELGKVVKIAGCRSR